jgi:hypothetical protein
MLSKYQRKSKIRDPLKRIIIAMEGNKTEPKYFDEIKKRFKASSLSIILLTRDETDTNSAPNRVIVQLKNYKQNNKIEKHDELWLIIDKDRWPPQQLSEVAQECVTSQYNMGLSNPCFEIWLILHFDNLFEHVGATWSPQTASAKLNSVHETYNISSYSQIADKIETAIENSKILDIDRTSRWPNTLGTRVYILAESILRNV